MNRELFYWIWKTPTSELEKQIKKYEVSKMSYKDEEDETNIEEFKINDDEDVEFEDEED